MGSILKTLGSLAIAAFVFGIGLFLSIDATKQRNPIELPSTKINSVSEGYYVSLDVSNVSSKKWSDTNKYYTTVISGTSIAIKTDKDGNKQFDYMFEHPFLTQGDNTINTVTGNKGEKRLYKVVKMQDTEKKSNLSNVNGLILEEQTSTYKDYMWIIFYAVTGIAALSFLEILIKPFRKTNVPNQL